jgi:hypothetical protein
MKAYISYRNNGEICGVVLNDREWPEGYDIMSSNPSHPLAAANRAAQAADPAFAGIVEFNCGCADNARCNCAADMTSYYYVSNGQLVEKPSLTLKINEVEVAPTEDSPAIIAPETNFTFTIESDVPDGTTLLLQSTGVKLAPALPAMVFSNGEASCILKAPPQGQTSRLFQKVLRKELRPFNLYVIGWA